MGSEWRRLRGAFLNPPPVTFTFLLLLLCVCALCVLLFFCLVFPPQSGVLSQVHSRDVFLGSLLQIGIARCDLRVGAYSDQRVQRWPTKRLERPLLPSIMTSLHSAAGVCSVTGRIQICGGRAHTIIIVFLASDLL